jgi:hypothetical protein
MCGGFHPVTNLSPGKGAECPLSGTHSPNGPFENSQVSAILEIKPTHFVFPHRNFVTALTELTRFHCADYMANNVSHSCATAAGHSYIGHDGRNSANMKQETRTGRLVFTTGPMRNTALITSYVVW